MAEAHRHGHGHGHGHGEEAEAHGIGHVAPTRALVGTGLALLVLTVVTVWTAGIHLGELNIFIALAIAVLKASLVGLFFMHLRWDRPFNGIVFIGSIALVALFLGLAMTDTAEYKSTIRPGDAPAVVTTIEAEGAKKP
jgi:cytochrome c oxidase subunit 4